MSDNETVRPLPETYIVYGNEYKLLKRGQKSVIYEGYSRDDSQKTSPLFEVFKIKISKATIIGGKDIPIRERLPSNESFGVWSFAYSDKEAANKKFKLLEKSADIDDSSDQSDHSDKLENEIIENI